MTDTEGTPERKTTGKFEPQQNGLLRLIQQRWVPWAVIIITFGAAWVVLKRCMPAAWDIAGVQTITAAAAVQKENDKAHEDLSDSVRVQEKATRHLGYKIEDVDEAILEEIKSRSPKRYKKLRDSRTKKWRARDRYETELEADGR
jgi:hypothetical protein